MEIPEETKPRRGETDGTAHDSILGDRHLDGMDAVQTVETLTALALAYLWDDPVNNNFDYPWEWRR
jgi:hypothetical protein